MHKSNDFFIQVKFYLLMISPHFYFVGVDHVTEDGHGEPLPPRGPLHTLQDRAEGQVQVEVLNSSQLCSQRGEKAGIYFKSHPKSISIWCHLHFFPFYLLLKIHVPK